MHQGEDVGGLAVETIVFGGAEDVILREELNGKEVGK